MFPPLSGHRGSVRLGFSAPTPAFSSHDDASAVPMLALLSADLFNRRLCSCNVWHCDGGSNCQRLQGHPHSTAYGFIRAIQRTGERINTRKDKRVQANEEEFP